MTEHKVQEKDVCKKGSESTSQELEKQSRRQAEVETPKRAAKKGDDDSSAQPSPAHQPIGSTSAPPRAPETVEINAPLLQLHGSDSNMPLDLSGRQQSSSLLR